MQIGECAQIGERPTQPIAVEKQIDNVSAVAGFNTVPGTDRLVAQPIAVEKQIDNVSAVAGFNTVPGTDRLVAQPIVVRLQLAPFVDS